jgi:hypothetical protein
MGGSGSGGSEYRVDPDAAARRLRDAEEASRDAQTDAEVNSLLSRRLLEVNRRNNEEVASRLEEIQAALASQIEGVDRLLFGGSVSKQTYVEGLSDVDSLLVLKSDDYGGLKPDQVLAKLQQALESKLDRGQASRIKQGQLSVTVEYKDGLEVQLLPAVERQSGLSIKSASGDRWTTIDPKSFAERLSKVNQSQAGAVVPAIKLAKSILAIQPVTPTPGGYHLEALAVAAFENYSGPRNPKAMVTQLFDSATKNVRRPIVDVTGQSGHVDEYLGNADSAERRTMSSGLGAIAKRMKNAPNADAWRSLLGED